MTEKVQGVAQKGKNAANIEKRSNVYIIKHGDSYLKLAQKFGMSVDDFKKWTKFSGEMKAGKTINLPVDLVPQGMGIYALARKYDMTMSEFCKLNGIPEDQKQTYKAGSNELFYVIPKTNINIPEPAKEENKPKPKSNPQQKVEQKQPTQASQPNHIEENKRNYGSSYTPEELAEKIYELSGKYGAVGKPDFDALINEINPKNASKVIRAYDALDKGESLINTITSEISSKQDARISAVMHVYDALAQEKQVPQEKREKFLAELNRQFNSWGMVDTKYLDRAIKEIIDNEQTSTTEPTVPSTPKPKTNTSSDNRKVNVNSKYPQTISTLQRGAIAAAKNEAKNKFRDFCKANGMKYDENKLDLAPFDRIPKAIIDKNGNIVPEVSDVLKPTKPNGKVIILNSGHGGYHRTVGTFDVGSYTFVKKSNGKYAPHLEYEKVRPYVTEIADKLRSQGYAVVITSGEAHAFSQSNALSNVIKELQNGTKGGKKYSNKDIAFVSFHADSSAKHNDENDKSSVCYNPQYKQSEEFANIINKNLNGYQGTWVKAETIKRIPGQNGVFVLNTTSQHIPSVLLETAHINGVKGRANLDSSKFRQQFIDSTILGLNEYFGIK